MVNIILLKMLWRIYRPFIIFSAIFIGALQFLIIWIFSSLNYVPIFEALYHQLPPHLQALLNEELIYHLSLKGAVAFAMNHPLVLLLLGIIAIAYSSRLISGEAEKGLLELLLSYPLKRNQFYATQFFSTSVFLLFAIGGGYGGSVLALILKKQLTLEIFFNVSKIGINLWFLFLLITSYALLFSVHHKERGKWGILAVVLTLIFYFLHFITAIWDELEFLKPINIFSYYQPQKIMFNEIQIYQNLLILIGVTVICFFIGINRFSVRDLP